jgi:hypothetical protein
LLNLLRTIILVRSGSPGFEQVRLITIGDEGYAVCGRLDQHPEFERWKDEMAPGELWSLFGEKWLAKGSAAK